MAACSAACSPAPRRTDAHTVCDGVQVMDLANDGYLPYAGRSMPTLWRGAIQDIADAGHAPHWEQPRVFDALVAAFARDCQAT